MTKGNEIVYEKVTRIIDIDEIKKILPHRYPMLLVDKVIELEPMKRAVGVKCITENEWFFQGHFPSHPIMPGVLLIEAMAQVGGVALMYPEENRNKLAMFGRISDAKFKRQVVPGDVLVTEAVITKIVKNKMGVVKCVGRVDGQVACQCECHFAMAKPKKSE